MPKISQFPAQTGASVANGDLFPIVDVGSPNVSEYITADELAQAPQFSSRYKPLASDTIWIPAAQFTGVQNSPVMGTLGSASTATARTGVMLFDASLIESVSSTLMCPPGWSTADVYLWWSNAGAGSGDVFWILAHRTFLDTNTTDNAATTLPGAAVTAPAQYVAKRTKLNSTPIATTSATMLRIIIQRKADEVGDTLGNDAGMFGVELVRAS